LKKNRRTKRKEEWVHYLTRIEVPPRLAEPPWLAEVPPRLAEVPPRLASHAESVEVHYFGHINKDKPN
jgi:hypothetical protein